MKISYKPLWKKLSLLGIKKKELWRLAQISSSTCQKLRNNEHVTTHTLLKICEVLECDISDIIEIIDTQREQE